MGHNMQERLDAVSQERLVWYAQHKKVIKLPRILMASCVGSDGWADLCGPAFKAANTRAAARFFKPLAARHLHGDVVVNRHVRLVTSSLAAFFECLYSAGMFLTPEELATLQQHTLAFGVSYQRLRNLAQAQKVLAWPIRPKVHKMQHAPELASHLNPVHAQYYLEESFMGTTAKVGGKAWLATTARGFRNWRW